jgi:hypothetical protein
MGAFYAPGFNPTSHIAGSLRAMTRKLHTLFSLLLLAAGLSLLAFMVTVEGEPGALPLALVVAGGSWFGLTRLRRS